MSTLTDTFTLTGIPASDGIVVGVAGSGIVIAQELTPSELAALDPEIVTAIATAHGSSTAHVAIMARALGVPAVVGVGRELLAIATGATVLLDGGLGMVTVEPDDGLIATALRRRREQDERAIAALPGAQRDATLAGGEHIHVLANIGSVREARRAVQFGAEGIGMLRTEFLFLNREQLPTEDEQFEVMLEIGEQLAGRPLIVRTLDAGADKPLQALPLPAEANPFLGLRGIRVGLHRPELLLTQLRAILRVAERHPLKLMLPMVTTLGEVLESKRLLALAREQTGIDAPLELGVAVEVPAAALTAAQMAPHVDFFSLGTNDLTQYALAADRGDERLAHLLSGPHPAVLQLAAAVVRAAATHGRWVGVCGDLGGDPASAVLLAGLGVDELSMSPVLIPQVKAALRQVSLEDARHAATAAMDAVDAESARAFGLALLDGAM